MTGQGCLRGKLSRRREQRISSLHPPTESGTLGKLSKFRVHPPVDFHLAPPPQGRPRHGPGGGVGVWAIWQGREPCMGLLKLKQTERREAPSTHLVVERGFLVRRDLLASEHHAMRSWNDGARGGGPGHAFLLKLKPYCKVGEVRRISDWEAPEKAQPRGPGPSQEVCPG